MQRKSKTKSKENQKLLREKKKSMKKQKVEPSSLVIFPNILTKENILYLKINSVKSKRKKKISKNIKQATSVLKKERKEKKCLLSPNKNNDL